MTFLTGEHRFIEAEEAAELAERMRRSDEADDIADELMSNDLFDVEDIDEAFKLENMLKGFWLANRIIQKEWESLTRWERAQVERDMRAELDMIESYGKA